MKLNIEFRQSSGWIEGFKKCSGLVYKTVSGEANSRNLGELETWEDTIHGQIFCERHL
jgi:hypothetical protein